MFLAAFVPIVAPALLLMLVLAAFAGVLNIIFIVLWLRDHWIKNT